VRDGAQDTEPAGVGDRGYDIAAMAESTDRKFHTEQLGDLGSHLTDARSLLIDVSIDFDRVPAWLGR
jgi:hypothetical protein